MITRQDFMDFFRSEEGYKQLSDDDCRELFATALKGGGDFTREFLTEVAGDYNLDIDTILSQEKRLNQPDLNIAEEIERLLTNILGDPPSGCDETYEGRNAFRFDFDYDKKHFTLILSSKDQTN